MNKLKRTFVIGDIHGEINKLKECLSKVSFNYEIDCLISLGDVVDRGLNSYEVIEELLKIKNLIAIRGNHDYCFLQGLLTGHYSLMNQGCKETISSYIKSLDLDKEVNIKMSGHLTDFELEDIPVSHYTFLKNQLPYYIDEFNNLYVHGGYNRHYLIDKQPHLSILWWDRDLLHSARSYESMKDKTYPFKNKNNFNQIYVGHTPVQYFGKTVPTLFANVWDLDTGAGKRGLLTIMNLETKEYFQF